MKMMNTKIKRYSIIAVLVIISIALIGLIYSAGKKEINGRQLDETARQLDNPTVEELVYNNVETEAATQDIDDKVDSVKVENIVVNNLEEQDKISDVNVEPIIIDEGTTMDISVVDVEEVDIPMVKEPEKPKLTPPEKIPETTEDLTDPDKVPDYDKEETTYVAVSKPVEEPKDEVRGSNLVPDSENPFLQIDIPSDGVGGAVDIEDISEYVPGTGDKF